MKSIYIENRKKFQIAALGLWLVVTFMILGYFAKLSVDAHHDGFLFKAAHDVASGKILFRDTYTQYGALTTYIQAIFLKLFGDSILVMKYSAVLFYTASFAVLFIILHKYISAKCAIIVETAWLFCGAYLYVTFFAWSSVYALFFSLISLLFILEYREKQQSKYIYLCGISAALTFWCRQPVGLVIMLAFFCSWILEIFMQPEKRKGAFKRLMQFTIACIAVSIVFLLIIICTGALSEWWMQSWKDMAGFTQNVITSVVENKNQANNIVIKADAGRSQLYLTLYAILQCLFPIHPEKNLWASYDTYANEQLWVLLPVVTILFLIILLYKSFRHTKNREQSVTLSIFCIYALASWHQYFPVSEVRHWYWASFMMFGICMIAIDRILSKLKWKSVRIVTGIIILIILFGPTLGRNYYGDNDQRGMSNRVPYYTQCYSNEEYPYLNGLYLSKEQVEFYDTFFETAKQIKEEYPNQHFLNQTPIHLYSLVEDYNYSPYYLASATPEYIKENKPLIITHLKKDAAEQQEIEGYYCYATIQKNYYSEGIETGNELVGFFCPIDIAKQ